MESFFFVITVKGVDGMTEMQKKKDNEDNDRDRGKKTTFVSLDNGIMRRKCVKWIIFLFISEKMCVCGGYTRKKKPRS